MTSSSASGAAAKSSTCCPSSKSILKETLGVIVYQEQVMQIANVLASYSLGEADLLRRAMGKKNAEEMAKQRDRFMSGAAANSAIPRTSPAKSSIRWRSSPATASTSRTRRPTGWWPIRPPISRRTIRSSSWPRC